jgi:peptide/nickel transport system ATP-binding protein
MTAVLAVENLTVNIATATHSFDVLSDLSFEVRKGEILALVGESGSGKSMTAFSVMRLLPEPAAAIMAGSIRFEGLDLAQADEAALRRIRGNRIGLIFQEPMTSLNPSMRVGPQVAEALRLHKGMSKAEARDHVEALFAQVRIPDPGRRFDDYPHQMSGGMRQRVVIALALACRPELLIADEPTTALDVTTQAQILDTIRELQAEIGTATILITHDLAVVAETADRVAVMYAGRIVEEAAADDLFASPRHPYTHGLMGSIPEVLPPDALRPGLRLTEIPGMVPALWDLPAGCAFAPRCPRRLDRCHRDRPPLEAVGGNRRLACWNPAGAPA